MLISTTVSTTYPANAAKAYEAISRDGADLTKIMKGYGMISGVSGVKMLTNGEWGKPDAKRIVYMEDGNSAIDHILEVNKPHFFSYEIIQLTSVFKYLIKRVCGQWNFDEEGSNTKVSWTYSLEPKSIFFVPLLYVISKLMIRPFLQNTLRRIRELSQSN